MNKRCTAAERTVPPSPPSSLLRAIGTSAQSFAAASLADLSLEQLSNIEVTSVSGRAESLQDAASSIYVITGEDIRRSAATSLPEALRLAPNLQVARLNAAQYAISARGFNNAIGNKLLVLIDGRTVYSPLFSGVFWDANDVMLEDIERIEVISGPGGTLWGANAVNGVINIITRPAAGDAGCRGLGGALRRRRLRSGALGRRAWARRGITGSTPWPWTTTTRRGRTGCARPDAASQAAGRLSHRLGRRRRQLDAAGRRLPGGKDPANNLAPKLSGANVLARWTGGLATARRSSCRRTGTAPTATT